MTLDALSELPTPASSAPLPALVAHWATATPDEPAVFDGAAVYTYRQVRQQARDVAALLRARGANPGDIVATRVNRSALQIVAVLGVLEAGCAVLPLETGTPSDRVETLLSDAGARLVLTESGMPPVRDQVMLPAPAGVVDEPTGPARIPLSAPACVMYTSGSTGRPKGVLLSHEALVRFARGQAEHLRMTGSDRVAQRAPFSTDAALLELILAFSVGAAAVVLPTDALALPALFTAEVNRHRVSVLTIVPSLLRMLLDDGVLPACRTLRAVASFGEQLTTSMAAEFREQSDAALFNLYGPTEVGIGASAHEVTGAETGPAVPIGAVTPSVRAYVCAADGALVPDGEPGELYVGGGQIAHGYLHQSGATAERFVADAYSGIPGSRLYRTGDRVIRRADGALCYLGRRDDQIKLRGVRIEPAEVEAVIQRHPRVRQVAVVAVPGRDDVPLLAAFVVGTQPGPKLCRALRAYLRSRLPVALVPSVFRFPDALPLLLNGKVDRSRLTALATFEPTAEKA
ncbi:amino acid adenylation domain-containing protein [Streptomyces chartreusis]|uniref:amino acid adenylation domain-containing protein n=1 Tax=Streptomyces chartreusis TaxID=1969 RepID=UPI0036C14A24